MDRTWNIIVGLLKLNWLNLNLIDMKIIINAERRGSEYVEIYYPSIYKLKMKYKWKIASQIRNLPIKY